jgi:hypothetical protein
MAYKAAFSPVEILWGGQWRTLAEAEVQAGPAPLSPVSQPITAG